LLSSDKSWCAKTLVKQGLLSLIVRQGERSQFSGPRLSTLAQFVDGRFTYRPSREDRPPHSPVEQRLNTLSMGQR
jgi:hypothetical protein